MSYQVLARKYRPQNFSDVIGQEHVTRTLKNAIAQERIAHGYIFSGHRGIGKTTVARILAMALNCRSKDKPVPEPCGVCDSCIEIRNGNAVDVIEIDAATNRGIDEIRELRDAARYRPARDRYKVYILDEAHQITDAAFNALLKTLEEPPGHVIFMMATTQPEDIPQTIRSRCQHFSFHAVRFDEIVNQLRSIATQEEIEADDDALAMLAEAGDGSMRDALSIMDQAIACCTGCLTADIVRQLVGTVHSGTLEQMMEAVQRNSSEDVLRLVDGLMIEGQNPVHFARQMVRFIRNAIVAKIAGSDSQLLQISSDERARVGRVAELFSEEDLTRFLQILLRTHSDLGYKQEQRFHLELGLLKLVHAQRLLPIEELLSGTKPGSVVPPRSVAPARSIASTPRSPEAPHRTAAPARPAARPSPFEADVSRKGGPTSDTSKAPQPEMTTSSSGDAISSVSAVAVAPAPETPISAEIPQAATSLSLDALRDNVLAALESANQKTLPSMLENGEWKLSGSEITIQVADSATVIELSMGSEGQRLLNNAASSAVGRPMKVRVISGGSVSQSRVQPARSSADGTSARSRAARDPIVKRMQEKFGAEIRTVMDQRDRR